MARRVSDYRIRRIADRGNEADGPDSRAHGDRFYPNRRSAARGNKKVERDPGNISEIKRLQRRVRDLEIQHEIRQIQKRIRELELQREMRKETESRNVVRDDVNEEEEYPSFDSYPWVFEPIYPDSFSEDEPRFDEDEVDIDEGERLFLEQALGWVLEGVPMALNDGENDSQGSNKTLDPLVEGVEKREDSSSENKSKGEAGSEIEIGSKSKSSSSSSSDSLDDEDKVVDLIKPVESLVGEASRECDEEKSEEKSFLEEEKQNLHDIIQMSHQRKIESLSCILLHLVHARAHHPSFPNIDECKDVKAYEPIYRKLYIIFTKFDGQIRGIDDVFDPGGWFFKLSKLEDEFFRRGGE